MRGTRALSLHLRLRDDGTQEETGLTTWRWVHRGHVLRRITYNPISVSLFLSSTLHLSLPLSLLASSASSFCFSFFLLFIFENSLFPRTRFPSASPSALSSGCRATSAQRVSSFIPTSAFYCGAMSFKCLRARDVPSLRANARLDENQWKSALVEFANRYNVKTSR